MQNDEGNEFYEALLLSNKISSNSHISFETALYFYGLIAEPPEEIQAVGKAGKHIKSHRVFRYFRPVSQKSIGIRKHRGISISTKEKAIADILVRRTTPNFSNERELEKFLIDNIGVCKQELFQLDDYELLYHRLSYNKMNVRLLSRAYSRVDGGRIWVADIQLSTTEDQLRSLFATFGEVLSVSRRHSSCGPIAFIQMKNSLDGKDAIRKLDGQLFQGRRICVKESNENIIEKKYVYALVSFESRECYIGETVNFYSRIKAHLNGHGCLTSSNWIAGLKSKPIPILLEEVERGLDTQYQCLFLEVVWRIVAEDQGWKVVNSPKLSRGRDPFEAAIENRASKWPDLLKESIQS